MSFFHNVFGNKRNRKPDFCLERTNGSTTGLSSESSITAIMNIWKRDHIEEQLIALFNQSIQPTEIWLLQCGKHVDTRRILKKYPCVRSISSSINLKYFGRFALARFSTCKYIYMVDDDVIPSVNWLQMCRELCEEKNAIVASAGRIIPKDDLYPERPVNVREHFIGDIASHSKHNLCQEDTTVDFGCNSWFLKTQWLNTFWSIPPTTLDTGEDIHLSASCKIQANISTIVPKQLDESTTGNLKLHYGHDEKASWRTSDFLSKRAGIIDYLVNKNGWTPILWH